ncbi:DUF3096 domain-containing protein [Rhodoblastus sp. 17X3]|nr:DUF3096 domain-containing protein [Rhodoblastus sp. 17X3]MDI9850050.1 DUF3096 domain-containing protein [Rhodoblastus sp. 17X3]
MHIPITHPQPLAAIVAGVAILVFPSRLNYILAAYLVLTGIFGLGLFR